VAALLTPTAYRRLGARWWIAAMLLGSAVVEIVLVLPYRKSAAVAAALLLAFASQSVKITVDTLVQHGIDDRYRGRVFALYDMLFNLALVAAATLTALALPEDGHSPAAAVAVAGGWLVLAAGYVRSSRRSSA
jgi:hypothetical protein